MANHKPRLENLKPFTGKGDPRNGRKPKGVEHSSTRLLRILKVLVKMKNPANGKLEKFSVLEQMDLKVIARVLKTGDVAAYKELIDRLEGRVPQPVAATMAITATDNPFEKFTDDQLAQIIEAGKSQIIPGSTQGNDQA